MVLLLQKSKLIPVKEGLLVSKGSFVVTFVRLLVCDQDYRKTAERITTQFGWQMNLGPE